MFLEKLLGKFTEQPKKKEIPENNNDLDKKINATTWQQNAVSKEKKPELTQSYGIQQEKLNKDVVKEFNKRPKIEKSN